MATEQEERIERAVKAERQRCADIAIEQYAYWRNSVGNQIIADYAAGAMAASANILGRIEGLIQPMIHGEKDKI